jgi:hypothetical protein
MGKHLFFPCNVFGIAMRRTLSEPQDFFAAQSEESKDNATAPQSVRPQKLVAAPAASPTQRYAAQYYCPHGMRYFLTQHRNHTFQCLCTIRTASGKSVEA